MYSLKDPDGKVIGGINFVTFLPKPDANGVRQPLEGKYAATVHMVYAFLDPQHRSLGLVNNLMDIQDKAVADYIASVDPDLAAKSSKLLVISEQNVPEEMDPVSYMTDSSFATKQEVRLMTWNKRGFRQLQLEGMAYDKYVQPALSEDGEPCDVLSLNAYVRNVNFRAASPELGSVVPATTVGADTLKLHLSGFFETSVVGEAGSSNPDSPNAEVTASDAIRKLNMMAGQSIKTTGFDNSLEDILSSLRADEITNDNYLSTASEAEINSGEMITDLQAARRALSVAPKLSTTFTPLTSIVAPAPMAADGNRLSLNTGRQSLSLSFGGSPSTGSAVELTPSNELYTLGSQGLVVPRVA